MSKIVLWILLSVVMLSLGGILWYNYQNRKSEKEKAAENQLPAVKIVLKNGCGIEGLATEFSAFLADKNIDIIATGNTIHPIYDKTIIVVRKDDMQDLKRLQRMTGITKYTVALSDDALAGFDIIIGKDFEQYTKK